jgi:hypothetical protein
MQKEYAKYTPKPYNSVSFSVVISVLIVIFSFAFWDGLLACFYVCLMGTLCPSWAGMCAKSSSVTPTWKTTLIFHDLSFSNQFLIQTKWHMTLINVASLHERMYGEYMQQVFIRITLFWLVYSDCSSIDVLGLCGDIHWQI